MGGDMGMIRDAFDVFCISNVPSYPHMPLLLSD